MVLVTLPVRAYLAVVASEVPVTVGNTAPKVSISWPVEGGFFDFNTPIALRARATDREDGVVPSDALSVELRLGHDTHTHLQVAHKPGEPKEPLVLVPDSSHAPYIIDRFAALEVSYTDEGASGAPPLTAREKIVLNPRRMEAENADSLHGAEVQITGSRQNPEFAEVAGVFVIGGNGDYLSYAPVNLMNIYAITGVVRSKGEGGTVEMWLDGPAGTLLAELPVAGKKASSGAWQEVTASVHIPGGPHKLFLVFRTEDGGRIAIDRLIFHGQGITSAPPSSRARTNE